MVVKLQCVILLELEFGGKFTKCYGAQVYLWRESEGAKHDTLVDVESFRGKLRCMLLCSLWLSDPAFTYVWAYEVDLQTYDLLGMSHFHFQFLFWSTITMPNNTHYTSQLQHCALLNFSLLRG